MFYIVKFEENNGHFSILYNRSNWEIMHAYYPGTKFVLMLLILLIVVTWNDIITCKKRKKKRITWALNNLTSVDMP